MKKVVLCSDINKCIKNNNFAYKTEANNATTALTELLCIISAFVDLVIPIKRLAPHCFCGSKGVFAP